jgi:hypothetical protein
MCPDIRSAPRRHVSASRFWWWPVGAVVVSALLATSTSGAGGSFTAAVANAGDVTRSGSLLTSAQTGGTTECDLGTATYSPISAANNAICSGGLIPSGGAPATGTSSTATILTDEGSLPAVTTTLTKSNCGPVQLANSVAAADPMLVRGATLSYAQAGPLTGSTGLGLSGGSSGSGYAADVTASAPTNAFTEAIWFKATTNGTLMGSTDTPSVYSPASWDRMLWLDSTGHVVFAIRAGLPIELTSPAGTYLDGKWHLAAGVLSTAGMVLYVDGAAVASSAITIIAGSYNGFWHVGWDNETNGWTNPPTTPYFAGVLSNAAIFPTLSAAQISNLYNATTQAAWSGYLTSYAAVNAWGLGDLGRTAYTGVVPNVTPDACGFIDVTVGTTGTTTNCVSPASTTACGAPTSSLTLASMAPVTSTTSATTPAQPLTLTVTIARDTTNTVSAYPYAAGLNLTVPLALASLNSGLTATLTWPSEDVIL